MNFFLNEEQKLLIFALNVKRVPRSPTLFAWERLNFYCCCSLCLSLMFVVIYWWLSCCSSAFAFYKNRGVKQNENFYSYFLVELDVWRDTGMLFHLLSLSGWENFYGCSNWFVLLLLYYTFAWQKNFVFFTDLFWLLLLFTFSENVCKFCSDISRTVFKFYYYVFHFTLYLYLNSFSFISPATEVAIICLVLMRDNKKTKSEVGFFMLFSKKKHALNFILLKLIAKFVFINLCCVYFFLVHVYTLPKNSFYFFLVFVSKKGFFFTFFLLFLYKSSRMVVVEKNTENKFLLQFCCCCCALIIVVVFGDF